MLVFARLPEPLTNVDIVDTLGRFIARGDMPYPTHKVLVEYDGWQHEREAWQRQRDRVRLDDLQRAGWIVIVVTAHDLRHPCDIVRRVHDALVRRGYTGGDPQFSVMWTRWFN
ncbi:MAG: DUF559 domain-containing protein [Nocardioidaceae bacterium]